MKTFPGEHEVDPGQFKLLEPSTGMTQSMKFVMLRHAYRCLVFFGHNRTQTAYGMNISIRTLRTYITEMRKLGWRVPSPLGPLHGCALTNSQLSEQSQKQA